MKLHVTIEPDGKSWFAQGLDVDYAAQGDSPEEALHNFVRGLHLTINIYRREMLDLGRLLEASPQEAFDSLLRAAAHPATKRR